MTVMMLADSDEDISVDKSDKYSDDTYCCCCGCHCCSSQFLFNLILYFSKNNYRFCWVTKRRMFEAC